MNQFWVSKVADGVAILSIPFQCFFNVVSRLRNTRGIGVRHTIKVLCCNGVTAGLTSRLLRLGCVTGRDQVVDVYRRGSMSLTVAAAFYQDVAAVLWVPSALPCGVLTCQIGMMTCVPRDGLDQCCRIGS